MSFANLGLLHELFSFLSLMKQIHENMLGQRMKTFNFLSILGEGQFSVVYQALDDRDDSQIAIKVIPKILIRKQRKLE